MTSTAVVSVENVSFCYGSQPILDQVSLSVDPHDFIAVIGPNGGGKSTLLKLIMGLLDPQSGQVTVFGQSPKAVRHKIGYLSQHQLVDLQFPIDVMEVVLMSRLINGVFRRYSKTDREAALMWLDRLGISHLKRRRINELSGGERQRVFLARALMNEPELLLLDEPDAGVDRAAQTAFFELLKTLNENMAIILVSHDLSAVSTVTKTVACLNRNLVYHTTKELSAQDLEKTYCCDIDLIAHGVPHRVLKHHD
ncbi:MAG: ABC transporter ATP-binding protein [Candidatus Margulisiibacteriota bacterium]